MARLVATGREAVRPLIISYANVIIGQLAPHITAEVDCESLFSQAGHASQPNRNRTMAETFERQVMAKHRMSRIFCCPEKVKKEFLNRTKKKAWKEEEDRDDIAFWEQQKEEYLAENPKHSELFGENDEDSD